MIVGTSAGRDDLETVPLSPAKWPPTSATTSSDESSSQSPSVARTKNFSEEDGFGSDDPVLGRESFRCVTTGVAVTYGGVFNPGRAGRTVLPVLSMNAFCKL